MLLITSILAPSRASRALSHRWIASALLAGGALQASSALAQPCQDPTNIRAANGCSFDATASRFHSALDNPQLVGNVALKTTPFVEQGQRVPNSWEFSRFELDFSDQIITPGPGSVSLGPLPGRHRIWPRFEPLVSAPNPLEFEIRGVRLGRGVTEVFAQKNFAVAPGLARIEDAATRTRWSLAEDTLLVPVSVIVAIPKNDATIRDRMRKVTLEYIDTVFDDAWHGSQLLRTSDQGVPVTYQGTWGIRNATSVLPDGEVLNRSQGAQAPVVIRPDDIWAQCGIQFRVVEYIIVEVPDHLANMQKTLGNCPMGTPDGQSCGNLGQGKCVAGTCVDFNKQLCDDAEVDSALNAITHLAGQVPVTPGTTCGAGSCKLRPDAGFGGTLETPSGFLGLGPRIVYNFVSPSLCDLTPRDGFLGKSKVSLLLPVGRTPHELALSHEIGHFLGLEHPDTNRDGKPNGYVGCGVPGAPAGDNKNLMCSATSQFGPHIHGCDTWVGDAAARFNCVPRAATEHPILTTCELAREKAESISAMTLNNIDVQANVIGFPAVNLPKPEPSDFPARPSFECDSPDGATIVLNGSAQTLAVPPEVITDLEWTDLAGQVLGSGGVVTTSAPLGESSYFLSVIDPRFDEITTSLDVNVVATEPAALEAPPDITLHGCGPGNIGAANVLDRCAATQPVASNNAPANFTVGTFSVTWTVTSAVTGLTSTDAQQVTVLDDAPPLVTAPPDINVAACMSLNPGQVTVLDQCDGTSALARVNVSASIESINGQPVNQPLVPGQSFEPGTTVVRYDVFDPRSNTTQTVRQRITVGNAAAPWSANHVSYAVGDRVTLNGKLYECITAHVSQTNWAPSATTGSLWRIPTPCGTVNWQANTFYNVGSIVLFNGKRFRCIQAHQAAPGWEPGPFTAALWQPVP